jgi:hypothetical protein
LFIIARLPMAGNVSIVAPAIKDRAKSSLKLGQKALMLINRSAAN